MKDIFSEVNRILESGQSGVIARIIRQKGSTPRSTGTRCLILEDGSIMGTIGGGQMEHLVMERAREVMRNQRSVIVKLALYGKDGAEMEMLCGGAVDIYLEPVSGENIKTREIFSELGRMAIEGRRGVIVTRVDEGIPAQDPACRILIQEDLSIFGAIEGLDAPGVHAFLPVGSPRLVETDTGTLFVEPVSPPEALYLFGAGHVSLFVCSLAAQVGFRVVVIDDRKDFANVERFPTADKIRVDAFLEVFDKITVTPDSYIVIVTHGHIHDRTVLREALRTYPKYIGMIGSRRKRDTIFASLRQEGVSDDILARVHCPIGLEIGAQTPEEIAVSILAELISVRNLGKNKAENLHRKVVSRPE